MKDEAMTGGKLPQMHSYSFEAISDVLEVQNCTVREHLKRSELKITGVGSQGK